MDSFKFMDKRLLQLTKKADQAEKDKNEAVIKYATREAEIMRMRADLQKKDQVIFYLSFFER